VQAFHRTMQRKDASINNADILEISFKRHGSVSFSKVNGDKLPRPHCYAMFAATMQAGKFSGICPLYGNRCF
jgi:hypothetical protein